MKTVFALACLTAAGFAQSAPPNTKIACAYREMVDVEKNPKLYWGTWYAIGLAQQEWDRTNMCTQVILTPGKDGSINADVAYTGSYYKYNDKTTTPNVNYTRADGTLAPKDIMNFDPPYTLSFPFLPPDFVTDFRIVATDGSDSEVTAMITYTCPNPNNPPQYDVLKNNSQVFFLSRQPYFVPPVTFERLAAKAAKAIGNFDKFNMEAVTHVPGWCAYKFNDFNSYQAPFYPYSSNVEKACLSAAHEKCPSEDEPSPANGTQVTELVFQILTLSFVVATFLITLKNSKKKVVNARQESLLPGSTTTY